MMVTAGLVASGVIAVGGVVALTPSNVHDRSVGSPRPNRRMWQQEDLMWISGAFLVSAFLSLKRPFLFPVLLPVFIGISVALKSRRQTLQKKKRAEGIASELPIIIELLALSISAGESPSSALSRVSLASRGVIGSALASAVAAMQAGSTLVNALEQVKKEVGDPRVDRCFDAIILGYERGTSLNDVLHAQALDSREHYRRNLIEASARAEIAMMVPVVFLIMPVTILFALFPSLYALTSP